MTDSGITTEQMTLKFLGGVKGNNRVVLSFENPEKPDYPYKFAVFDNPPELRIDSWYRMTVQHKPMSNGTGFYHNIARKSQDGPYLIEEAPAPAIPAPAGQSTLPADQKKETIQRKFGDPYVDPKEKYWQEKAEYDKTKDIEIRRMAANNTVVAVFAACVEFSKSKMGEGKFMDEADLHKMTQETVRKLIIPLATELMSIEGKKAE